MSNEKTKKLKKKFKEKYNSLPPSNELVKKKYIAYKQVAKVSNKYQGEYRKVKNLQNIWFNWLDACEL